MLLFKVFDLDCCSGVFSFLNLSFQNQTKMKETRLLLFQRLFSNISNHNLVANNILSRLSTAAESPPNNVHHFVGERFI